MSQDMNERLEKIQAELVVESKKISALDSKFLHTETRLNDLRNWTIGIFAAGATIFGVLAIVFTWNVNAEKQELRVFRDRISEEVNKELGKVSEKPKMEMLTQNREPLAGKTILGKVALRDIKNDDGTLTKFFQLEFSFIVQNIGDARTGPIYTKVYSVSPIVLSGDASDEPDYEYETHISPELNDPSEFPAGVSTFWLTTVELYQDSKPKVGEYPCLVKIYYGKKEVESAAFTLKIIE